MATFNEVDMDGLDGMPVAVSDGATVSILMALVFRVFVGVALLVLLL